MPEPELLDWLEALGGDLWQPQPLDIEGWLRGAEPELQGWNPDKAFRRCATWFEKHAHLLHWFENDTATIERAEDFLLAEEPQPEYQILEEILEPHRPKWRDRFVLMAIWARSNLNKRGPQWQDFALLAQAVDAGRPVVELPILPAVAGHTLGLVAEEMTAREEVTEGLEGEEWEDEEWEDDEFSLQHDLFSDSPSAPARSEKVGRNEPCPCGSGKKHKKCCMAE
ncbi:SEC-C metal-binding domain-containing protein [Microbulbifer sp.]|uniref:SEC-C metal-binding domain-containing protein n=1 Tax=Microbulbifer sp. TaxID=1908541 RepID=UPI003F35F5AF